MMQSTTATPCQFTIPRQPTVKYAVVMHTKSGGIETLALEDSYPTAENDMKEYIAKGGHYNCHYYQIEKRYYP